MNDSAVTVPRVKYEVFIMQILSAIICGYITPIAVYCPANIQTNTGICISYHSWAHGESTGNKNVLHGREGLVIIHRQYDDVIKWKFCPRYWPFVRGIHRSLKNSPHKGRWRGTWMFSLIYSWTNGWVNNREAVDLRRHCAHYGVVVMKAMAADIFGDETNRVSSVLVYFPGTFNFSTRKNWYRHYTVALGVTCYYNFRGIILICLYFVQPEFEKDIGIFISIHFFARIQQQIRMKSYNTTIESCRRLEPYCVFADRLWLTVLIPPASLLRNNIELYG